MYKFINPYNFIPFGGDLKEPDKKDKSAVYRGEDQTNLLSGWLDVSMIIKSPLIIPDGAHPKYFDLKEKKYKDRKNQISNPRNLHLEYDFLKMYHPMSGNMEYGIPGSEIRGMIRSTYEAVTNSCVPFLQSDKPMSQRVPLYGALRKRGLLGYRNGHWTLYSTEKTLEEVIVVPVYAANGNYYIESIDKVRKNKENNRKDAKGAFKYKIMDCLDRIEKAIRAMEWKGKPVQYGAVFVKNEKNKRKWDIKVDNNEKATAIDKVIDDYLFIRANGSRVEAKTAAFIEDKGWLQYNVPVDLTRIYHVAYLKASDPEHVWENTKAEDNEEAYKKLLSAITRDGAETYRNEKRVNNQVNRDCNFALENALNNACHDSTHLVPVYYFKVRKSGSEGELVYLSGSAAGRIAQRRKWKDIFEGHTPCDKKLCPACLLFGTIKDGGMKGHVRFSDAFLEEPEKVHLSEHTLQILSSPRATAFEFYLKKPDDNATYWNYDFYGVTEGGNAGSGDKTHTNYYHLDKATPRGRKMYWHHPLTPDDKEKRNMNNTHQSMDNGIFTFKVYFDQITEEQLKDLIWVISFGDNHADSKLQHKIGHAKPLGYGSVKLLVKGGKIRKFECNKNGEYAYCMCGLNKVMDGLDSIKPSFDVNSQAVQSLLKMCDVDAIKSGAVDYPRTRCPDWNSERGNQPPIYEWFAENRTNPKTLVTLPEPTDSDISLQGGKKDDTSLPRMKYKVGDIVDAVCDGVAENKNGQFGVFVKLQEKQSALLHRTKAAKMLKEYSVGMSLKVKIIEIKEENGRKKYSVTDKI